jgi:hypothetical protein
MVILNISNSNVPTSPDSVIMSDRLVKILNESLVNLVPSNSNIISFSPIGLLYFNI